MKKKLLEWYPAFMVVETQEDGTTNKFIMITYMDKGIFEALQELMDLNQFFYHNYGSKNLPSTKNDQALYWKSFAMAEKGQVDSIILKISLEMSEKIGKHGK